MADQDNPLNAADPPVIVDENSVNSASELSEANDSAQRRASKRPRRSANASGTFVTETELDAILTDPSESVLSREDVSGEYEKWVNIRPHAFAFFVY